MQFSLKNLPCIVGVSQHTYRPEQGDAPHPLLQMVKAAENAAKDCGNKLILKHIDEVDAVLSLSWGYDDLPKKIAEQLALKEGERKLSGLSGTGPQRFLNEAAENILNGGKRAVLVCGAEAFATKKRAKKEGRILNWPKAEKKAPLPFEDPFHPAEIAHEFFQAYTAFALLDSARRAHHGISLSDNRKQQAQMMASLSEVAANNPQAWFRKQHSAESLFNLSDNDRMVAYPFSKNTMAFMDVDMSAALIMVSNELADELNISQQKRIYLNGWGYAKEPAHLAQRQNLWRCPSMEVASSRALQMAGINTDDIQWMDLYSCFAGNINFTKEVLGIEESDKRSLTLTGGLPYFGGPGNNYTTHSIATLVERLRAEDASKEQEHFGLISAVGMHMTNHAFAVYSNSARPIQPIDKNMAADKTVQIKEIALVASGPATIAAYTVEHNKLGKSAIAICDLPDGTRCYARSNPKAEELGLLEKLEQKEWVGKTVQLHHENNINYFDV